jgi:hypothetical protein
MSTNYPQVGGYPQYPQSPQYTPPAYRLYDVGAVALAAFLGSPLAGTVLMASNYRKLGQGGNAFLALVLGAAASVGEIYIGLTSTKSPAIATLVLFAVTWFAAWEQQGGAIKTHVAWGGQLYSYWRAFGVATLTTLVLGGGAVAYLYHTGQLQKFITQAENQQKQAQTQPTQPPAPQNQVPAAQNTVTIGTKDQVVYSGTATANDATALGNALKAANYFQDRGVTVLLSKGAGGTVIGFVIADGAWNQAGTLASFEEIARGVASTVGGLPVQVQLLNSTQTVEKSSTVGEVDFAGGDAVIYEGTATQADAQALGQQFKTIGFFGGKGANVFLTKDGGTTITFVVADGTWSNATMVTDFETIVRSVAPSVGGLPIDLRLDNTTLTVEKDEMVN